MGKLSDIQPQQLIAMPLLVETANKNYAVITKANLTDWSGAFLCTDVSKKNTVVTDLAPIPNDPPYVLFVIHLPYPPGKPLC